MTVTQTAYAERELLGLARGGDEAAFGRIAEAHRRALQAHCYRMLGSIHDAEDAVQETLLRAWRGLRDFEERSSLATWLYRIATNTCLDAIERRPKRVLPADHGPAVAPTVEIGEPLVESTWVEPYPDDALDLRSAFATPETRYEQREAVELAFIVALQHLPGTQRAVLILREVLGFSAREVAESLDTSVASVNSALQRARATLADRLPERSQQETLRSLGDERVRELVAAFVDAWSRGDVEALRTLLAEDAVFSMPPWSLWWHGAETLIEFVRRAVDICPPSQAVPCRANGQPALAHYSLDAETGRYVPSAIDVLTFEGDRIREITTFVLPDLFPRFGLATALDPER
jgi:RNA polymerase sigma-70 factor (ECF subfamily)